MHYDCASRYDSPEFTGQLIRQPLRGGKTKAIPSLLHNNLFRISPELPVLGEADHGSCYLLPRLLHDVGHTAGAGSAQLQRLEDNEVDGVDRLDCLCQKCFLVAQHKTTGGLPDQQPNLLQPKR